jgi:SAM-dependent methyltransferase
VTPVLTPARRSIPEILDDLSTDPADVATSSRDIATCNRWFGGTTALLCELQPLWPSLRPSATLLDIGCGVGDLLAAAKASAAAAGVDLTVFALDHRDLLASSAAAHADHALVADAFSIPLCDAGIDIVTACQFLHHFSDSQIAALAREMNRVARRRVVISDLRRSWVAAGGLWLASWPLRLHPITRHDGVLSVLKGFVPRELGAVLNRATGRDVSLARRHAFRVTANWTPSSS